MIRRYAATESLWKWLEIKIKQNFILKCISQKWNIRSGAEEGQNYNGGKIRKQIQEKVSSEYNISFKTERTEPDKLIGCIKLGYHSTKEKFLSNQKDYILSFYW